jgi:hypothetical protein
MVARDRLLPGPHASYFAVAQQRSYVLVIESVDVARHLKTPALGQKMTANSLMILGVLLHSRRIRMCVIDVVSQAFRVVELAPGPMPRRLTM